MGMPGGWRLFAWAALLALVASAAYLGYQHRGCFGASSCTRVLFIGNSYTAANDLPFTFQQLAGAGGHAVETDSSTPGGYTLRQHLADADTEAKLKSKRWDFIVLQEQSEVPADATDRAQAMYPAARELIAQVRSRGAEPILFETWAHQYGWPQDRLPSYEAMQEQVDSGYNGLAAEQRVTVAPVGEAWRSLRVSSPSLDLWQPDGSHPTPGGTYLAACVFFATVFNQTPVGLDHLGIDDSVAARLQAAAAAQVLGG